MELGFELQGLDVFEKLERALGDISTVLNEYAEWDQQQTDRQFDTESDPYGVAWKPIKPEYRRQKGRKGLSTKTGTATGETRKSLECYGQGNQYIKEFNSKGAAYFNEQRQLVEDELRGLPEHKQEKLRELIEDRIRSQLGDII